MPGPPRSTRRFLGGKEANKHADKKLRSCRRAVVRIAVAGVRDRETSRASAAVVENTDSQTLHTFIERRVVDGAKVYTDDHRACRGTIYRKSTRRSGILMANTSRVRFIPWDPGVLAHAQAGSQRHDVPQDQPEAHAALRHRVRRPSQQPRSRDSNADGQSGKRDAQSPTQIRRRDSERLTRERKKRPKGRSEVVNKTGRVGGDTDNPQDQTIPQCPPCPSRRSFRFRTSRAPTEGVHRPARHLRQAMSVRRGQSLRHRMIVAARRRNPISEASC